MIEHEIVIDPEVYEASDFVHTGAVCRFNQSKALFGRSEQSARFEIALVCKVQKPFHLLF